MPVTKRLKAKVVSEQPAQGGTTIHLTFSPTGPENTAFFHVMPPGGALLLYSTNEGAFFQLDKTYFVDFTLAP